MKSDLIRWFADIRIEDVPETGGKNASLGEMVRELTPRGVRVPDGFAITAAAYRDFLHECALEPVIRETLQGLQLDDVADLQRRGALVRRAIRAGHLPIALAAQIRQAYQRLSADVPAGVDVAVRSSATAEDLPEASFAGQQETYLNVRGEDDLLDSVLRCYASLFTDRAISYRAERGYDHLDVALSVGVQRMVRSDLASAGVMFTLDPESGFRDVVLVSASWGLGETVVQGSVSPDEYLVFKPTLATGHRPIIKRALGSKEFKLVYDVGGERRVKTEAVPQAMRERFALTDDEILELARQAVAIEEHYTARRGVPTPLDIEWAKDGRTGELFIVQARPETVQSRKTTSVVETYHERGTGKIVTRGRAVGQKIASGRACVIHDPAELSRFRDGDVLVAERTDPDWEPVMRRASAIVTDKGGRTCHAAIVSRELGVPAVVGAKDATRLIQDGQPYTVSCAHGDDGLVYEGAVAFDVERIDVAADRRPKTKIMMNVGAPSEALRLSQLPSDGVGLAREEFIISSAIGIHPQALLDFERLEDPQLKTAIALRTSAFSDKASYFVDNLAEGVALIAAAFYPRPVIVRLSDFKTNEDRGLLGGHLYEPAEENPMIGWRGASRYYSPKYRDAFALECRAIEKVRDVMGLTNLKVMIPFCRTVAEGRSVIAEMGKNGLVRGERGLQVYVMCEIPSNAILAERFAEVFDGFSIGSNDLTQLVLGVDRDSEILAPLFDENDAAVKAMIARAIEGAHNAGRPIGICGQAPSDHPAFAAWLVEQGIDSLSLTPDAVLSVTARVLAIEAARAQHQH